MEQQQQPIIIAAAASASVTKTLTQLLQIPGNRSCADCRSALMDLSQVHASYSPPPSTTSTSNTFNAPFLRNHVAFAPPGTPDIEVFVPDLPVDPAVTVAAGNGGCAHGVFVCALCAAAHKLLGRAIAIVKPVHNNNSGGDWSVPDVQWLSKLGGNVRATTVLEHYYNNDNDTTTTTKRPTATCSVQDRLVFVRAKYQALAFALPHHGPLAAAAWQNIIQQHHPDYLGLCWGANLLEDDDHEPFFHNNNTEPSTIAVTDMMMKSLRSPSSSSPELPNRLVDYFCVVTASHRLQQPVPQDLLSHAKSPEDFVLAPMIADCYPNKIDNDNDSSFPQHVATFCFPEACRPSCTALPPMFFTLVLTNGAGERLYGGVLRLYDVFDTVTTLRNVLDDYHYSHDVPPPDVRPPWLQQQQQNSTMIENDVMFLPKCLVVLSHYPFFDLWRKFLLQIYRIALTEAPLPVERFVANFVCEVPLPPPGKVQVKFGFTVNDIWSIERPPENQLPMANFSYQPLFACLSASNVLVVMGCLLQETRVALLSKHYALLTPVAEALLSLLFPFHWQGMYLPVMPYGMLEILDAPVPYLVGLHSRYLSDIPAERRPHGVVFVDLDRDEVHLGFSDDHNDSHHHHQQARARMTPSLPERHALKLKAKLLEFASPVYILPNTQKAGSITTGSGGRQLTNMERDTYAQVSSAEISPLRSMMRRRDIFSNTDKAYRDNELLEPISGFLGEQGQLSTLSSTSLHSTHHDTTTKGSNHRFMKNIIRAKSATSLSSHGSPASNNAQQIENLLDMDELPGFSSTEIRHAFLRFFVSLFQDYRLFLDENTFRTTDFVTSLGLPSNSADFVTALLETQMFQIFTAERRENPSDPEVLFFDESIIAKINRSKKMTLALGGKRETAFLNDTKSMVTETFTPPAPSNWGLPAGVKYHYSTFPKLNHDLFGKTRPPMAWKENSPTSKRISRMRASAKVQANEQAVVEKATRFALATKVRKRGARNLETALKALSKATPFSSPKRAAPLGPSSTPEEHRMRKDSNVSDVTLPSTFDDFAADIVSSAEEVILDARRKQAILLGIIIELQALCRGFLIRKRRQRQRSVQAAKAGFESGLSQRRLFAATQVQSCVRTHLARIRFARVCRAVVRLQSISRGLHVRCAYHLLLVVLSKLQAVCRGHLARQHLSLVIRERMKTYKRQIFLLWRESHTPLAYRTKFWPLMQSITFVRLAITEKELLRLWKLLDIKPPEYLENGESKPVTSLRLGARFGISNTVYWKALKVEELLNDGIPTPKAKVHGSIRGDGSDRVAAERTQVYQRLSSSPHVTPESTDYYVARFSILKKEKKKKAALTKSLWCNYEEADDSVGLMLHLFPELSDSTNICFMLPSRKSLRRLPSSELLPQPLERAMWAHTFLDDRIRRNVKEVADAAIRLVPPLSTSLDRGLENHQEATTRRRLETETATARRMIIQEVLLKRAGYLRSVPSTRTNPQVTSSKTTNPLASSNNGKHTSYPGENFWDSNDNGENFSKSVAKHSENGETSDSHFPGDSFWVQQ